MTCYDYHNGTDISPKDNDHPYETIKAAYAGTVINPTVLGYGNEVMIDHHNGYATLYGHLKQASIHVGDEVIQSQAIGIMGNTGRGSIGVHLHFGVYYDKDANSSWTENEVVDPYGWKPLGIRLDQTDPWLEFGKMQSIYLWKHPLNGGCYLTPESTTANSASGLINVFFPPNAVTTNVTFEIWDIPPVAPPSNQNRTTGHSFSLRILEWISDISLSNLVPTSPLSFSQPISVTQIYSSGTITHLNEDFLQVFRWNDGTNTWIGIPTTINKDQKRVIFQTTEIGEFDLQAPLLCPSDINEPDDNYFASKVISTTGTTITNLFDIVSDEDWLRFDGKAGWQYTILTKNLATGVDTQIAIFNMDGATLLVSDNDSGGGLASKLVWRVPVNGTYFIRVSQNPGSSYGCSASYGISIKGVASLFMPMVAR